MRYPLPLREMRALLWRTSWAQIKTIRGRGMDEDDLWSEVWARFARKQPYDPSRSDSPARWVCYVGRSILLDMVAHANSPHRGGTSCPETARSHFDLVSDPASEDVEGDVLDLLDLADELGVAADALAAVSVGWTAAEAAGALGLTVEQVRDVLRARLERAC